MLQHTTPGSQPRSVVAELAARVRRRMPVLADTFADRMVAAEPVYAERFEAAERLTACTENIDALLGALVTEGQDLDPGPHQRTGRRNAELEVPLESLLHLYRLAAQMVWGELISACGNDPDRRDALLEGATGVWEVVDVQSAMVAAAYQASLDRIGREQAAKRAAAVSTLLAGGDGDRSAARRAVTALGLGDGPLMALAHPTLHPDRRTVVEGALGARSIRSVWQVRGEVTVGVAAVESLPEDLSPPVALAIEPNVSDVTGLPAALELAVLALRASSLRASSSSAGARPVVLAEVVLPALLLRSPDLARRLVEEVFGDAATWQIRHADLLETVATWSRCEGDATRAAAALYCHRNTVFNRLRRLQDLTGRSLDDPVDLTQVVLAVEALRVVGPATG